MRIKFLFMEDIKKVEVNNLKIGMYVSQFDRPWLETSFFYHKFLIKSDKQIDKIKRYCSHVYIDTNKGEDIKTSISATEEDKKIEVEMKEKIEDALKRETPLEDKVSFNEEIKEAKQVHDEAKIFIKTLLDDIRLGKSISSTNAKKVVDNMTESVMRNRDALLCFTQLKKKDEYTSFHSISVSILCLAFGRHMGYQKNTLKTLGLGGLLHDVGKMALRVIVWVILYLLEHTSKNFELKIFLITKTVRPSLYDPNLIIEPLNKA